MGTLRPVAADSVVVVTNAQGEADQKVAVLGNQAIDPATGNNGDVVTVQSGAFVLQAGAASGGGQAEMYSFQQLSVETAWFTGINPTAKVLGTNNVDQGDGLNAIQTFGATGEGSITCDGCVFTVHAEGVLQVRAAIQISAFENNLLMYLSAITPSTVADTGIAADFAGRLFGDPDTQGIAFGEGNQDLIFNWTWAVTAGAAFKWFTQLNAPVSDHNLDGFEFDMLFWPRAIDH
jgi:hypothetical protein